MLPGGVLAIASCDDGIKFVAARHGSDPQALAACRASTLAAWRFEYLMGLALTNDGLLVCSLDGPSTAMFKFATDGSMDELATAPVLADYDRGFSRCAVHQQTQRTYAIGNAEVGNQALVLLDSNLQVVATVEDTGDVLEDFEDSYEPIRDVAVHGDQVIVLASHHHAEGSGLRLLHLDGRFSSHVSSAPSRRREQFRNPHSHS